MKHFTLVLMAAATLCSQAFAQKTVKNIYTSSATLNLQALEQPQEGQQVNLNRTLFAGYNSICLPMSLNGEQLQEAAKGVQVERLAGIRQDGETLNLYFLDCTSEGIEAGVPYLIFSPQLQTLRAKSTSIEGISTVLKAVTKSDEQGNQVTFGSSWESLQVAGRYGIPALQDNDILQSILIKTTADKTFLPTRCGFTWDSQSTTATKLEIKHVTSMDDTETSIAKLQAAGTKVDIYTTNGTLVQRSTVDEAMENLPRGIYVINGQKFAVK